METDKKTGKNFSKNKIIMPDIFQNNFTFSYHWGKLFLYYFEELYSVYEVFTNVPIEMEKFIERIMQCYIVPQNRVLITYHSHNDNKKQIKNESEVARAFIIIQHGFAVCIDNDKILIMYSNWKLKDEVLKIAEMAQEFKKNEKPKKKFFMITRADSGIGYALITFDVKEHLTNIEDNYNNDFPVIHNIILDSLNVNKKNGLILLHGNYGSGKTYYIRHLISTVEKRFIYLPLQLIGFLTSPDFLPFIAKFENSVLILEDCEDILMHREDGNSKSEALSNLLNIGDGLLSDALSLNIICSFNANLKKIDDALLRKGRLIARYEFKELEIPKAQALADKLEKNIFVEKPMTLTDIYNTDNMKFENKKTNRIGFAYV